nr:hypothetical protein [Tanacetum cinerariifolium]
MPFISSSNTSSGKGEGHTDSVPTTSTQVSTASTDVAAASLSHDTIYWKLYDTCGVHYVSTKDQEIFMLVEKDYPLRKGLATMMISNRLQVEQYSQMASDLILKIHNIANSPR